MRSKKFYLSIVAVILLLSVVGVVLAQENAGPPESADLTKVKEDAVRAILDNDGKLIDPKNQWQRQPEPTKADSAAGTSLTTRIRSTST